MKKYYEIKIVDIDEIYSYGGYIYDYMEDFPCMSDSKLWSSEEGYETELDENGIVGFRLF